MDVGSHKLDDSLGDKRFRFVEGDITINREWIEYHVKKCDVVVPRSRVDEFIKFTHEIADAEGIRIPSFGHAGDGNLHVYICRDALDEAAWEEKLSRCFDRMYEKAEQLGGLVSGEHGIGYAKKRYMQAQYGDTQTALMRGIKAAFDPKNILNPGKICY